MHRRGSVLWSGIALALAIYAVVAQSVNAYAASARDRQNQMALAEALNRNSAALEAFARAIITAK